MKASVALYLGLAAATMCVGCSSGASSAPATHDGGGHSTAAGTPTDSSGGGITVTGAFTASMTVTLCTSGIGSIAVKVDGDSSSYVGSISASSFGFVGPGAADYTLKSGQPHPAVSANGTVFTVENAQLSDEVSGKTVTASGSVSCPS